METQGVPCYNGDNGDIEAMARRASLEPKKTTKPHVPWLIELPPALSSSGKRERHYFSAKKEAEEFGRQQRIRLENYGTASTLLPAGKIEEAAAAFQKLEGTGASLIEAVEHYLKWRASCGNSVTFSTMFERFRDSKAGKSDSYKRDLRQTLDRFPGLHDKLALEITSDDVEAGLSGMKVSVRNAFLRNLRAAFNFGIRRGWCEVNPVLRIEMEPMKRRKQVLTNSEVTALLKSTVETDMELLPYQLFLIFAGIRPKEVERLTWENVNLAEEYVVVPDEASKTDMRRIVDMEPLLVRWLKFYASRGGEMHGQVVPKSKLRTRLRQVRVAAGIKSWPQDAPRRTYASCWLAVHNEVNKLNNLMGHTTPDMLWRHYHKAVLKKDAEAFWKIEPPRVAETEGPVAKAA